MKMKATIIALFVLTSLAPFATAQQPANPPETPTEQPPTRFWEAKVGQNGSYIVSLDRISSVSRHQYVLESGLLVDEVTVDTIGQALVRFYTISPITDLADGGSGIGNVAADVANRMRDLAEKAAQQAGVDPQSIVVKTYPTTTHAKEIEFLISSKDELGKLYDSVKRAWDRGRGEKVSVK